MLIFRILCVEHIYPQYSEDMLCTEVLFFEVLGSEIVKQLYMSRYLCTIIGITRGFFHALTFAGSRGSCLKTRPLCREFKHLPRDPASVNAM